MPDRLREAIEESRADCQAVGASLEVCHTNGNHRKMIIRLRGHTRTLFMASTASDWRAGKNNTAKVRRALRELVTTAGEVPAPG